MHPDTELRFISPEIGHGVFASAFIPKGSIVYIKDLMEIVIQPDDPLRKDPRYAPLIEKYSYEEPNGNLVFSWDIGRFVNHCCACNTISTGYGFEIALRDIEAGEEITDEYGLFNSGWEMKLSCSKPGCRGKLSPGDIDVYAGKWDEQIKDALKVFNQVPQPLEVYMEEVTKKNLDLFLQKGEGYVSVLTLKKK